MAYFAQGGHYYRVNGSVITPDHEAGMKEVRARGLYVSPTTVAKVRYNWGLENWRNGLLVETVRSNPQLAEETDEAYIARVKELAAKPAGDAASFGTELHDALEHFPHLPANETLHPWIHAYEPWHTANVVETVASETMLAHRGIGVAGKTDKVFVMAGNRITLADYKTTEFKPHKTGKKLFYESWVWQLAFYARTYQLTHNLPTMPACLSIAINSKIAEPPKTKEWTPEEVLQGWREFILHAWLWQSEKDHWPAGRWNPSDFWELT